MEEKDLVIRIEQFFNAELSVEEERELCRYLSENEVPAELRKDKEAILLLCGHGVEVELPAGAQERIEAMIDALAAEEVKPVADEVALERRGRRAFKVPRIIWQGVAAAAVLVAGYVFMDDDVPSPGVLSQLDAGLYAELPEVDTFDNPADAMECFRSAVGDIALAVNAVHDNTRNVETMLYNAVAPYKEIIKIELK